VHRARLGICLLFVLPAGCDRPEPPSAPPAGQPPLAVSTPMPPPSLSADEQAAMAVLAEQGAQALSTLSPQADIHHGATWFRGTVSPAGTTAYLYLGKLGEGGSSTLRFVIRYQGTRRADLGRCTVIVDGAEVGSFTPAPNRIDQPTDGSVLQLADIHFDEVRPIILALIEGQSALIRTGDSTEIRLDRPELEAMRRVLSAYLHIQSTVDSPPTP